MKAEVEVPPPDLAVAMRRMQQVGELPLPGGGATGERWSRLAEVAASDLSLAKIYESHVDARAILAELGAEISGESFLAVWAAEPPGIPLLFDPVAGRLTGEKWWCSGAAIVEEGLLTAQTPGGAAVLVRVRMGQPGIMLLPSEWAAAGMAAAGTCAVKFEGAVAAQVGEPGAYLERPGFWQGGAGIAAVWYGGATALADRLASARQVARDPHAAAHLGEIFSQLQAARALLIQTAAWIDEHPRANAMIPTLALRASVEQAALATLRGCARALGAVPLCTERAHAQRAADLEIYLRQSHAERDLAALGAAVAQAEKVEWRW